MGGLKRKARKSTNPFDLSTFKTERTAVAILMHWMREIIEKKDIELGMPDVETSGSDRKMPDTVIYESRRSQNILVVVEAKPPYYDVFNEKELKEPARKKATQRKAKYFTLTNFKQLIWFNTEKVNVLQPEEEQIIEKYALSELDSLENIEQPRYSEAIKRGLEDFLTKLSAVHSGKEPEPKLAIDEFLVFRLQEKIRVLSTYYRRIVDDQCHKNTTVAKRLTDWFLEQGWGFSWQPHDFDKAARQAAYLLVNKILFYDLLQAKRPQELAPLEIPAGMFKGAQLQKILQSYFDEVLAIDYETIYTTDFIDAIAFPDVETVVEEIKELINVLKRYDFSTLGYDVIGRIFEQLIPQDERHSLGQYFTNPDVVDLILRFCLVHEEDMVLDPSCGAGTFLVRAYQHKKLMNQRLEHEQILETLWGDDIAKFPAHLATINLAINNLGVKKNYPNIIQEDFFAIMSQPEGGFELPEKWRKVRAKTLGVDIREITFPRWFDAVIGNPPYTRQEEISEAGVDKGELIENALKGPSGKKIAHIGRRAGIHAYFFTHATKFLRDGGYFGFIVSNSWLDVDYGKGLQEFFLYNYKIIAIIESKVERWFEEADINTCIIILQKCEDKNERAENLVRFVYLKKPLRTFIPPAQNIWENQIERTNYIDKLKKTILAHNKKIRQMIASLDYKRSRSNLRLIQSGDGTIWLIEKKYLFPVIRNPESYKNIFINIKSIDDFVVIVNEPRDKIRKKIVEKYILHGETKTYKMGKGRNLIPSKTETCSSRRYWYRLSDIKPSQILWQKAFDICHRHYIVSNAVLANQRFYHIYPRELANVEIIATFLNSPLVSLYLEFQRAIMGLGAIEATVEEVKQVFVINPKIVKSSTKKILSKEFHKLGQREIGSVFEEIGAYSSEDVSFDKVKPDRRELDNIIMGEILGLTDEEQLEVYRAVVDLVKSRIEKAKSFGNKTKAKEYTYVEGVKNSIVTQIKDGI